MGKSSICDIEENRQHQRYEDTDNGQKRKEIQNHNDVIFESGDPDNIR